MNKILKTTILWIACLGLAMQGFAQQSQFAVGYSGPLVLEHGMTLRYTQALKSFSDSSSARMNTLILEPQVGFFTATNNHLTNWVQIGAGLRTQRSGKHFYWAPTFSAGYMNRSEVTATTVNLQGDITKKEREQSSALMGMMNLEAGWHFGNTIGIFARGSYGHQVNLNAANSGFGLASFGLTYRWN